jgi:hypothetical protein
LALLLCTLASSLGAQVPGPNPADWLGLTPDTAYRDRGAPSEVYAVDLEGQQPQAIHFYADHSYLFWASNRVWQVRLDRLWVGPFSGVTMGMPRGDVEAVLGEPVGRSDTWSVWNLPYQTFPRRLRLVFTDGLLSDAYFYRSDL